MDNTEVRKSLFQKAIQACDRAYCPYSKYPVGAALLTESGDIITGGNVENASYGGTICAERSALVRAIAEGHTKFKGIVIATHSPTPASPCGICRQFMFEFGKYPVIITTTQSDEIIETSTSELLPWGFGPHSLDEFNSNGKNGEH